MNSNRKFSISLLLTFMMISVPWASADVSQWIGPDRIASSGQTITLDGWNVPGNATILDSWMTVDEEMVYANNGSEWRVDTPHNFSVGQFTDSTMDHFDGRLSIEPDDAVSQVDSFLGTVSLQFEHTTIQESGNTSIWEPGLPSIVNGTQIGSTMQMPYGNQPANAYSGSLIAATLMNASIPAGIDASLHSGIQIPSPINHFNLSFWNWRHSDVNDGMWVEYKLDNGPWTWFAPVGGYNSNITLNSTSTPTGTPNNSATFPVWSDVTATGWSHEVFNLDSLPNINNSVNIEFRWRIVTDANSSASPGWFLDDMGITNVGGATGYWHHGCYVTTGTCMYSNNAVGVLDGQVDLTNAGSGSEIQIRLEWDLEGSSWDNFCVELSSGTTRVDISSGTSGGGTAGGSAVTACRSRTGTIPYSGYTMSNGTMYQDETNGFVTLELPIPSTFQNAGMTDIRIRVDTDSSVQYGGSVDNQEGLTVDRISVVAGNGSILDDDPLSNSTTMTASGLGGATHDWAYISIGAGALSGSYGFEDSTATAPTPMAPDWSATGSWEYGALQTTTAGPTSWPSGPFGLGTNLAGSANDGSIDHLYSPPYTIPAGASARLTFEHWMCAYQGYAGGAVFISTDNNTWTHFDPGNNWYDQTGYTWGTGTLQNLGNFDGSNSISPGQFSCIGPHNLWDTKVADLSMYSGQTVWFRFTYEPYSTTWSFEEGWYLDDVGLEVDYFYDEGNWISDVLQVDEVGNGIVDIDGMIPDDTWATGTILDAAGNSVDGFTNLSFPISLHGLDRDAHAGGIRVQINMGTDDPFLTPLIEAVHVGSIRTFDARGPGNGWNVNPNLDLWNSNLTNNGSAVLQINAPFTHSSRPVTAVQFSGVGTQVTLRAIDADGNAIGTSGITGTIQFPEPQPGFGVRIEVNPGGRISSLWAEGDFAQPVVNPEVDVTSDGTIDWSFPTGAAYGNHGWQQLLYQTTTTSGTTNHVQDTSSNDIQVSSAAGATVSVLIPEDATVSTVTVSTQTPIPVDISIGSSSAVALAEGYATTSLSPSLIAHINMIQPSHTQPQTGRDWRVVEFDFTTTSVLSLIDVKAITVGYSISENITDLTQQMIDYHAIEIAPGNVDSVNIPLSYTADRGAVAIDGGIYHELMITNYPFTVPQTMYPDGQVVEITTRHQHLYDNDEISKITLTGQGSDGTNIVFEVENPSGNAVFNQVSGANQLPMEIDCSVSEIGNILNVDWRFKVSWTWDDVASIIWSSLAYNLTGDGIAPATALSGGQGSQAIENDLEISGFIVRNSDGYDISNRFSPEYPFHVRTDDTVDISGTVRFQNTIDTRPLQSDFAMIVNDTGVEQSLVVDGDGTYGGTITMTGGDNHTMFPTIGRVGPVTGATGANDTTISPPTIDIMVDDVAPIAGPLLVSTSVGLLDADGYVWDPVSSLTVYVTVSDEQDRDSDITLNYWREGYDDGNGDGIPQASEYQTMVESLFTLRSGSQQVTFAGIPVATNGFNGKVSLWLSGTDWAGNSYQDGGTGGAPGFDTDWATLQTAENTETVLLNTGFTIDSTNDYLLAGQVHTISMTVMDENGVTTLDDIGVYLAGQLNAPLGEMHYDPRQDILSTVSGSHVTPISASITPLSLDTARVDITFSISWDMPPSESYRVPGITITDDMQIVSNVNNLQAIHWKLDNEIRAVVTRLGDLTPPQSPDSDSHLYVRQGDEVSIEGLIVYGATNVTLEAPSENLSVYVEIPYGGPDGTALHRTVTVQEGGAFTAIVVLPPRPPYTPSMSIELSVLYPPGLATTALNSDPLLTVDSVAPEVQFAEHLFPMSSLLFLESDRLDSVAIDILIHDAGGFPTTPLAMEWSFHRSTGAEYMGYGGTATLDFIDETDDKYRFGGIFNMRPANGARLTDGDYMAVWFSGEDFSGYALTGEGSSDDPRYPSLNIIEFNPVLSGWTITPLTPDYGDIVTIELAFENEGLRAGTINVSLLEEIEGNWRNVGESVEITLGPKKKNVVATFEWEAWKEGDAQLYVVVDDDTANSMPIDKFEVKLQESESISSSTLVLAGVAALLGVVVVILLIIVLRRPHDKSDVYDESDDIWFDDDGNQIHEHNGIRLDYEDETLSNTASRHGIFDKMAFLQHAQKYDRDKDGFLDAEELDRAAKDFLAMLSQPMASVEASYPLDFNNETIQAIISQYGIHDRQAFLTHASRYDADQNGYLKQSELDLAASEYISGGYNQPVVSDPRELAIAEVRGALPDWPESKVEAWMDKGWTASQIIEHNVQQLAPTAPAGFGEEYDTPTQEQVEPDALEPEPGPQEVVESTPVEIEVAEVQIMEHVAEELPSEAALKRMKKAELVDLAKARNLETSGTKADIISRLLD